MQPHYLAVVFFLFAVGSARGEEPEIGSSTKGAITAEMIGRRFEPMRIEKVATESTYGYSEKHPVPVGGGFGSKNHYAS
jgi:hypothetical protein